MSTAFRSGALPEAAARPGAAVDLLAAWRPGGFLMERRGTGIVTAGELRRIEVAEGPGQATRAAIVADDALAGVGIEGAVVTAALPFRGDATAHLVIPERITVTSISPRELDLGGAQRGGAAVETGPPTGSTQRPVSPMRWRAAPPAAAYAEAVAEALSRIRAGELEKVVLARALVAGNPGIDLAALLAELRRRDPECDLFAAPADEDGAFVGATPETLLRREGDRVVSLPRAGTERRPRPWSARPRTSASTQRWWRRLPTPSHGTAPSCASTPSPTSWPPPRSGTLPPRCAVASAASRRAPWPWRRSSTPPRPSAGRRRTWPVL